VPGFAGCVVNEQQTAIGSQPSPSHLQEAKTPTMAAARQDVDDCDKGSSQQAMPTLCERSTWTKAWHSLTAFASQQL